MKRLEATDNLRDVTLSIQQALACDLADWLSGYPGEVPGSGEQVMHGKQIDFDGYLADKGRKFLDFIVGQSLPIDRQCDVIYELHKEKADEAVRLQARRQSELDTGLWSRYALVSLLLDIGDDWLLSLRTTLFTHPDSRQFARELQEAYGTSHSGIMVEVEVHLSDMHGEDQVNIVEERLSGLYIRHLPIGDWHRAGEEDEEE